MGTRELYVLAVGAFGVATQGLLITVLAPTIADDLQGSLSTAGFGVAIYALTYAIGSPISTALVGAWDQGRVLATSSAAFVAGNVLVALAADYVSLFAAFVVMGAAAGLFMPAAYALAATKLRPDRPGGALAVVGAGLALALVIGVPLGTFAAGQWSWRLSFLLGAVIAAMAFLGIVHRAIGAGYRPLQGGVAERLNAVRRPAVLFALLPTVLWSIGNYSLLMHVTLFLFAAVGLATREASLVLLLAGLCGLLGIRLGGAASDRYGHQRTLAAILAALVLAMAGLSASARTLPEALVAGGVYATLCLWAAAAWAFRPAQQIRVLAAAPRAAATILSLNQSAVYLGGAIGATLGAWLSEMASPLEIGWLGAACNAIALTIIVFGRQSEAARTLQPNTTLAVPAPGQHVLSSDLPSEEGERRSRAPARS